MSDYLVAELRAMANVSVRLGNPTAGLFVMIGAEPRTDWLGSIVARDERGFILLVHRSLEEDRAREPARQRR